MLSPPKYIPFYLLKPARFFQGYRRHNLRPDLISGLTVAVILLPQSIAFALIAELPPEMGLYAAIVAAIIGALWGSSNQIHTGPTNALSLLVLSSLIMSAQPGTPEFVVAAGLLAVMVGLLQLTMGLVRLGVLVNFVSHSVVVGFRQRCRCVDRDQTDASPFGIGLFKPQPGGDLGGTDRSCVADPSLYRLLGNRHHRDDRDPAKSESETAGSSY